MIQILLFLALALPAAPQAASADSAGFDPLDFDGWSWREVGPYRGGRAAAVCGVPSQDDVYYMGACGGGVWKTEDGGARWECVSDGYFGGSIGALAVSAWDPNVVYAGGGETTVRGNVSHGEGVWRSDDAGRTWKHAGLPDSRHIGRLRVHPRDPDLVYAAALGHLFGPNEERGIFRSRDAGQSWERVLFVAPDVGAADLCMDPTNPRILYATMWRVRRTPYSLESGGEGSGVWKSTDGGDTWTELTDNEGLPDAPLGIGGVTVSPTNPDNVYLILEAAEGGVFRSRDAGETWKRVNSSRDLRQRAWYYSRIYADPANEDALYVVNVRFHRSVDGGKSFSTIGVPHGDNHDLWIAPDDPERMVQANDGGANVSYDGGRNWSVQSNQPTAQMYRVSTDADFPYRLLGGQQDNSAVRIRSRSLQSGSIGQRDWEPTAGGESGHVVADPERPDVVYGGSYGGTLARVDHGSGQRRSIHVWPDNPMGHGARHLRYRFNWNFPLFLSPHASPGGGRRLYAAAQMLFASDDEGASWSAISPDLTRADATRLGPSGGPITKDNTCVEYYATLFAAAESAVAPGTLWCGSDDGLLHVSRDAGASWSEVSPPFPEWTMVNSIDPHPSEAGGAYVAGTRYKLDDFEPYLYRTRDHGATWARIDAGIPRGEFTRVVRADPTRPGLLFAGTERGVWVSLGDGASWGSLQLDLPIVPITDLALKNGDLVAATQGRGYWILDDLTPVQQWEAELQRGRSVLFEPAACVRVSTRASREPRGAGTNPASGVVFSYRLSPEAAQAEDAPALEILSAEGELLRRFEAELAEGEERAKGFDPRHSDPRVLPRGAGFQRFAWDLSLEGAESFEGMVLWNGGLAGPRLVPGTYQARLVVAQGSASVPFEVLPDPRTSVPQADLVAQFELLRELRDRLTATHRAVARMRVVRGALGRLERALDQGQAPQLRESLEALRTDLVAIEEALYQTQNESPQDPLNFPIRLNDRLAGVMGSVRSGDYAPTAQQRAVAAELSAAIEQQLALLAAIEAERLPALNRAALQAKVPALPLPK